MAYMNKELVRAKLKELREAQYPTVGDFAKVAKLHDANVRSIEDGRTALPSLESLERWLLACGTTLSQFFAQIEALDRGKKPTLEHELVIAARALVARDLDAAAVFLEVLRRTGPARKQH